MEPTKEVEETFTLLRWDVDQVRTLADRERVFGWILFLGGTRLLGSIAVAVEIEAAAPHQRQLPDDIARAVMCGRRLLDETMFLVRRVVEAREFESLPEVPSGYEQLVIQNIGRWLRTMRACERVLDGFTMQRLAGLGGGGPIEIGKVKLSSGVHALWILCCSLYNGMAGCHGQPFEWVGKVNKVRARRVPPQNRKRPATWEELERDDRSILLALLDGAEGSKRIGSLAGTHGKELKAEHVRKRKQDLVTWGLLTDRARAYELTCEGREVATRLRLAETAKRPSQQR